MNFSYHYVQNHFYSPFAQLHPHLTSFITIQISVNAQELSELSCLNLIYKLTDYPVNFTNAGRNHETLRVIKQQFIIHSNINN